MVAPPATARLPLTGGTAMPRVGLGTWPLVGDEATRIVGHALDVGYRLIDTSEQYGNEEAVGAAIRSSRIPRDEIFVTTKFNAEWHGVELVQQACSNALKRLGLAYIDLFLIHWPNPWLDRYVDAWKGLLELRANGQVRAVGTSNFTPEHIERLLDATGVAPEVNQIELDPTLPQHERRAFHDAHAIVTEAWSPLGRGGGLLSHPTVLDLAERHGRSPAQILLRWHLELDIVPVPRSSNPDRVQQNVNIFDFQLSSDEMTSLATLAVGRAPARDPETHGH